MSDESVDDLDEVVRLLGRRPRSEFSVVVRQADGSPLVIRNAPFELDGTPMPTLYWLLSSDVHNAISQLESIGGVRQAEHEVDTEALALAHARYATERDQAIPTEYIGPRPSGGVGGTRRGVKCLHAHYAWYLAGGDDPVGAWVEARINDGGPT
jgi:hypothetical protein